MPAPMTKFQQSTTFDLLRNWGGMAVGLVGAAGLLIVLAVLS